MHKRWKTYLVCQQPHSQNHTLNNYQKVTTLYILLVLFIMINPVQTLNRSPKFTIKSNLSFVTVPNEWITLLVP